MGEGAEELLLIPGFWLSVVLEHVFSFDWKLSEPLKDKAVSLMVWEVLAVSPWNEFDLSG